MRKILFSLFKASAKILAGKGLWKLPFALRLYNLVYKFLRPRGIVLVKAESFRLFVDAGDKGLSPSLLMKGKYDEDLTGVFENLIKPGMVVVDAGAHVGYCTLLAAKLVGNRGKVYAFEPEPHNYEFLVRNIELNGCQNVQVERIALSNKQERLRLHVDKANLGNHSMSATNVSAKAGFVEVEATTLDSYLEQTPTKWNVDFMKMDVQGAEGLLLEGAKSVLRSSSNLAIAMEFWPFGLRNLGSDPRLLLESLPSLGFKLQIVERGVKSASADEIMAVCEGTKGGRGFVNLLLEK